MAVLDGLATLSESGSKTVSPKWRADVFGLSAGNMPSRPASPTEWTSSNGGGSAELLARTRGQGFSFVSIQQHLLGPARNVSPGECQQQCQSEPKCMAWQVCAPVDQTTCEGCYLIGTKTAPLIKLSGFYGAMERA